MEASKRRVKGRHSERRKAEGEIKGCMKNRK